MLAPLVLLATQTGHLGGRTRAALVAWGGDRATFARHLSSEGVPRFYLHVCNGNGFTEDAEGQEFADIAAARWAAINSLREIMAGEMQIGELDLGSFIEIEDANHEMVVTVSIDEAVCLRTARGKLH